MKIIAIAYIYQLAKFGDLMSCGSKDIFNYAPFSCTDTNYDVTELVNHAIVEACVRYFLSSFYFFIK